MCQAGGAIRAEETHRIQRWIHSAELLGATCACICRESSRRRQRKAGYRIGDRSDETRVRLCGQAGHYSGNRKPRRNDRSSVNNRGSCGGWILLMRESILIFPTSRAKRTKRCIPISGRVFPLRPTRTSAIFFRASKRPIDLDRFSLKADTRDTCPRNMKLKKIR